MTRIFTSILLIMLCAVVAIAAGSPIAGTWKCVSTDERGMQVEWTLVVTETAGKLSGSLTIAQTGDQIEILEPVLTGNTFTFKIRINAEEVVELTGHLDGAKIDGSFKGKTSGAGTFKGSRQA
jgi:hypothetical protein